MVAARLQAISYADPYVFVHADDVLDPEALTYQDFAGDVDPVGWVPDPPVRRPSPPPRVSPPAPPGPPRTRTSAAHLGLAELRQRLELAGGGLLALLVLGFVAAAVAVILLLRAQPHATAVPRASATVAVRTSSTRATPTVAAGVVTVDVTGKVHHPGVFKLTGGSRVIDAVRAAGGALHGTSLDALNLAAKLTDGQQVAVGAPAAVGAPVTGGTGGTAEPTVVDLNAATVEQLQTLPGIGPVLAQHIVDYRTQHGPFASVDGLQQVTGIGPSKFAQLKEHVSV